MTDPVTEDILRDLGEHLHVPAGPDPDALALAVLGRLDEVPRRPLVVTRLVAAVLALLITLGVAMAVSPRVRASVLEFLRVGGVELNQAPAPPLPSGPEPLPQQRTVSLDLARDQVGFPLRVPAALGDPDAVQLAGEPTRVVSLIYAGVRVDQFAGGLDPMFRKFLGDDDAEPTTVDGSPAVWLPDPHPVFYLDRDGVSHQQSARLSGSTLVWERDDLTYRVEGELTREQAVAIGESLED